MSKKERISIRLDSNLISDLKLISALEDVSLSFIIRTILDDYIKYYLWKNIDTEKNFKDE